MTSFRNLAMSVGEDQDQEEEKSIFHHGTVNNLAKMFGQSTSSQSYNSRQRKVPNVGGEQSPMNRNVKSKINATNSNTYSNPPLNHSNSNDDENITRENFRPSTRVKNGTQLLTKNNPDSVTDNVAGRKTNTNVNVKGKNNRLPTKVINHLSNQDNSPSVFKVKLKKVGIEKLLQEDEEKRKASVQDEQMNQSSFDTVNAKLNYQIPQRTKMDDDDDHNRYVIASKQSPNQLDHDMNYNSIRTNPITDNTDSNIENKMIEENNTISEDKESAKDNSQITSLPPLEKKTAKPDNVDITSGLSVYTKGKYVPPPSVKENYDHNQSVKPNSNDFTPSLGKKSNTSARLAYNFAKTGKKKTSKDNTPILPKSQNSAYQFSKTASSPKNQPTRDDNQDEISYSTSNISSSKSVTDANNFGHFIKKKSKSVDKNPRIVEQINSNSINEQNSDQQLPASGKSILKLSSNSDKKVPSSVKFSNDQPQINFTHSADDYERVIDIDAALNVAQNEIEKSLRNMDLVPVELAKYDKPLGVTIKKVWVGENGEGDDLLSVYIDSIVPGGIADRSKNVRVGDLIVQIGQNSLIAATGSDIGKALAGLNGIVKFVFGREKPKQKISDTYSVEKQTIKNSQEVKQNSNTVRSVPTKTKPIPNVSVPPVDESSDEDDGDESDSSVEGAYHFGNADSDGSVDGDKEVGRVPPVQITENKKNLKADPIKVAALKQVNNTKQNATIGITAKKEEEIKINAPLISQKEKNIEKNNTSAMVNTPSTPAIPISEQTAKLERVKYLEKELQETKAMLNVAQDKVTKNTTNVEQIKSLEKELQETKTTLDITESKLTATTNKIAEFEKSSNQVLALEKKLLEDQIDRWKNRAETAEKRLSVVEIQCDNLRSDLLETKRQSTLLMEQFSLLKEQVFNTNKYDPKDKESIPDDSDESSANGSSEENSIGPPKPPRGKRAAPPIPVSSLDKDDPDEAIDSESELAVNSSEEQPDNVPVSARANQIQQPSSSTDSFQHYSKSHPDMFVEKKKNIFHKLKFGRKSKKTYNFDGANSEVAYVNEDAPTVAVGEITVRRSRDDL
ncbi:Neurabin-1 [Trichoplax sp. H2]|nr:Neurabin-1 [Trichoplax sp. H2]|eukprot:RDD46408.1 Neurabin-1 [Trichoplax sp. H2]